MTMSCDDAGTSGVQRFEVFTGAGRRRDWPDEVRASIVAESFSGRETVSAVARRHALSPSQLFTWRREARQRTDEVNAPVFVPAMIAAELEPEPAKPPRKARASSRPKRRRTRSAGDVAIKMEAAGVTIWIDDGASPATIAAVIGALKGVS